MSIHTHTQIKVFKIFRKFQVGPGGIFVLLFGFFGVEADLRQWEECKRQGQGTLSLSQDRRQSGNGSLTSPSFPSGVHQSYTSFQRSLWGLVTLVSCQRIVRWIRRGPKSKGFFHHLWLSAREKLLFSGWSLSRQNNNKAPREQTFFPTPE